jgi:hypothetical protein
MLPSILAERDRWPLIDGGPADGSIAKSLGARCFTDGNGAFIIAPTPSLEDSPSWSAVNGPGGVLINSTEELSDENTYNMVVASGENTDPDTDPVGPQIVGDSDKASLTYYLRFPDDGGYGQKPFFYTSQLFTTERQCWLAASGRLADLLGLKQQITFDQLHDPAKEPGDVGTVTMPGGNTENVILDAVTYDFSGGALSAQTRTTATKLAGDIEQAPDVAEGDAA